MTTYPKVSSSNKQITANTHSGEPINLETNDRYGYLSYCKDLLRTMQTCATPFTIGVYGRWGFGKSSVLLTLENMLNDFPIVKFNPWNYDLKDFESVWGALLCNFGLANNKMDVVRGIITAGFGVAGFNTKPVEELISLPAERFEKARITFANIVKDTTENKQKDRLFVFIDDLDRCEPEISIYVLRAIQVLCRTQQCIFVLAMDREVITSNLQQQYGNLEFAREYLDKVIQLPSYLPQISDLSKVKEALGTTQLRSELTGPITKFIAEALTFNPRKIERFLFLYDLIGQGYIKNPIPDNTARLFSFCTHILNVILQIIFPDVYGLFRKYGTSFIFPLNEVALAKSPVHLEGILAYYEIYPELRQCSEDKGLMKLLQEFNSFLGTLPCDIPLQHFAALGALQMRENPEVKYRSSSEMKK